MLKNGGVLPGAVFDAKDENQRRAIAALFIFFDPLAQRRTEMGFRKCILKE